MDLVLYSLCFIYRISLVLRYKIDSEVVLKESVNDIIKCILIIKVHVWN